MTTFNEGGLGLGLEWARCPKCRNEGTWENDVFECGACFGTFRRTPLAPDRFQREPASVNPLQSSESAEVPPATTSGR